MSWLFLLPAALLGPATALCPHCRPCPIRPWAFPICLLPPCHSRSSCRPTPKHAHAAPDELKPAMPALKHCDPPGSLTSCSPSQPPPRRGSCLWTAGSCRGRVGGVGGGVRLGGQQPNEHVHVSLGLCRRARSWSMPLPTATALADGCRQVSSQSPGSQSPGRQRHTRGTRKER
jgi:hypothetical protein